MPNPSNKSLPVSVAIASHWRSLKKNIFDSYRPELHYMRGPGPKWHAKHRTAPQPPVMSMLPMPPPDAISVPSARVRPGFCRL